MDFLNVLKNHIFKFKRFFEPLKECPVVIQTFDFQMRTPSFNVNLLVDIFFENVDVRHSKFK